MELKLSRVDYMQVGLTSPKTTRLLPSMGGLSQQKVAVGDQDGVLQVFSVKKQEISHVFKSLPTGPITRLELGGALGTVKDKIFASSGNEVRGYTKKGKLFLGFDTNMTDAISSMSITGNELCVAGTHVYNHYTDCKDANSFLSEDVITDVLALPGEKVTTMTPVIASQDRSLKVLKDSNLMYSVDLPGPPSTLQLFYNDGGEHGDEVLYGTTDGKIGFVHLTRQGPQMQWTMEREGQYGTIQCLDNFDITGDGVRELVVGRHDGTIEVYAYEDGEDVEPTLRFSHNCGECVTSVEGGVVGNAGFEEILATTYTGWIFGLTSESKDNDKRIGSDTVTVSDGTREKIARLRSDIDRLQVAVTEERDSYQAASQNPASTAMVSAIPKLNINDRFTLSQADASYNLSLEVQTAIDHVLLQSDVPVDLLDVEKNSAVVSYSACDPEVTFERTAT